MQVFCVRYDIQESKKRGEPTVNRSKDDASSAGMSSIERKNPTEDDPQMTRPIVLLSSRVTLVFAARSVSTKSRKISFVIDFQEKSIIAYTGALISIPVIFLVSVARREFRRPFLNEGQKGQKVARYVDVKEVDRREKKQSKGHSYDFNRSLSMIYGLLLN